MRPDRGVLETHLYLREESMRQSFEGLLSVWRHISLVCEGMLEQYGLGMAHYRILFLVGSHKAVLPSELCMRLGITKQSLGRALGDLKNKGLIEQRNDEKDRRRRPVFLTETGKEVEARLFAGIRHVMMAAYRQVDGTAVDGFRRVLRAIELSGQTALAD